MHGPHEAAGYLQNTPRTRLPLAASGSQSALYMAMAYMAMAYIVMVCIVVVYMVMAYIVMAYIQGGLGAGST